MKSTKNIRDTFCLKINPGKIVDFYVRLALAKLRVMRFTEFPVLGSHLKLIQPTVMPKVFIESFIY